MHFYKTYTIEKRNNEKEDRTTSIANSEKDNDAKNTTNQSFDITELTKEKVVVQFVKDNHELPDCYIKKSEARRKGWEPSKGNLCEVLPGKAIGGDKFSNREGQLPKGEQYYEADINFSCGHRQTDRMIFTKNGDVWVTHNHYKSFEKQ
ncbi:MAG: ribonuclease N [Bacteroidetes bacterium]|nr:ribonuclease N [Bacteroidota bacterium]